MNLNKSLYIERSLIYFPAKRRHLALGKRGGKSAVNEGRFEATTSPGRTGRRKEKSPRL